MKSPLAARSSSTSHASRHDLGTPLSVELARACVREGKVPLAQVFEQLFGQLSISANKLNSHLASHPNTHRALDG
jgi:hypothetical protein